MGNETLPERVIFGEVEGGKGYLAGQEHWMGGLEHDLMLFNFRTEAKQWAHAGREYIGASG